MGDASPKLEKLSFQNSIAVKSWFPLSMWRYQNPSQNRLSQSTILTGFNNVVTFRPFSPSFGLKQGLVNRTEFSASHAVPVRIQQFSF